ncbi:hypothetical protein ROE7235_01215 [Roseibaca ekhonensis]|uniref:Type II secretion system protein GspC N-terminal domain-containing protein n=1 Tax=Roseinatronobacter ekhonensis TaxID=254356 RepID=A0A3B0MPB7_9RHOB|nr:hypothetical protein [Roseibaca ekhonensis]SUZ31469.1 hypothetical protein ROE7235_01215 [Roseibaca ekhonensis]
MRQPSQPLPEHLRPLPPERGGGGAWLWQVPVAVALTLGLLYLASGRIDHCAADGRFCPPTDELAESQSPLVASAPPEAQAPAMPERPVMSLAFAPLPLSMGDGPPAQGYSLPPGMTVQDAATSPRAIALDEMNLIAVVEADGHRHALVRLPDGRILRVREGDRLDGGTVAAIGADTLYMLRANNTPHALVLGG